MKKLQNTKENKARFDSCYFGQEVAYIPSYPDGDSLIKAKVNRIHEVQYLELTSLSNISDELLIKIGKEVEGDKSVQDYINDYGLNTRAGYKEYFMDHLVHYAETVDILRREGVAVPYESTPVEELVELGWIRIKEI